MYQRAVRLTLLLTIIFISFPLLAKQDLASTQQSEAQPVEQTLEQWLEEVKQEAVSKGMNEKIISQALSQIVIKERIKKLDTKQPEKTILFDEYKKRVVTTLRVKKGIKLYRENRKLLTEISKKYGVQPRFIIALWGIETDYGRNTGGFFVPSALATLAYQGRRAKFFRSELMHSLQILSDKHIDTKKMLGSWAGAMGQCQFMPSSFNAYAVDYDRDGKTDIWTNKKDIFASIANYLAKSGWDDSSTWGRAVKLPDGFDKKMLGRSTIKTIKDWGKLGVLRPNGNSLPNRDIKASIVIPESPDNQAFIIYSNYKTILKWNRSLYFATAVGMLSDRIKKGL